MALRPVSTLGLSDATDLAPASGLDAAVVAPRGAAVEPRPRRRAGGRPARPRTQSAQTKLSGPPLGDEPTSFVQIMVAGELQERLADVSHLLAAEHRKLRHQKTIIGALVWRYVDADDPQLLRVLGETLDAYLQAEVAEVSAEIKVGAHLPFSLKYKLDGAALALRRTRRAASAKTLLSALIWQHVERGRMDELVSLLSAYREALTPTPMPLPDRVDDGVNDVAITAANDVVGRHAAV